jgi:thiosulfate/3-mercaptopyruvate sulfurtransferase
LTTEAPPVVAVHRDASPWPDGRFVSADDLASADAVVVDARTAARFAEGDPAIDPRGGHVPGARSLPWAGNLDAGTGRFLPVDALRRRYGLDRDHPPSYIAYCGSGVTACHDLLALTVCGHDDAALYPGSWSQWGADPSRPAATGDQELTDP